MPISIFDAPLGSRETLGADGHGDSAAAREQIQERAFSHGGGGQSTALAPWTHSATRGSHALNRLWRASECFDIWLAKRPCFSYLTMLLVEAGRPRF